MKRLTLAGAITTVFAVFLVVVGIQHELWRDEMQAWLIARDAFSVQAVIGHMRYEGTPARPDRHHPPPRGDADPDGNLERASDVDFVFFGPFHTNSTVFTPIELFSFLPVRHFESQLSSEPALFNGGMPNF